MLLRSVSRGKQVFVRQIATEVPGPSSSDVQPEQQLPVKPKAAFDIARPNYLRKPNPVEKFSTILTKEYLNEGNVTGAGARLWDYYETAKIVRSLPTVAEKIDFVNPYERPWVKFEKTWRRDWHPALASPRKAWALPSSPTYYDCLPFYQYITKTRFLEEDLSKIYEPLNPPTSTLEQLFSEAYSTITKSEHYETEEKKMLGILAALIDDGILSVVHNNQKLGDYRVAYDVQSESFWIKAGFQFLYDVKELGSDTITRKKPKEISKYPGDDRRYLGELAFVHRDRLAVQIRSRNPLSNLFELNDAQATLPIFAADQSPDVLFSPRVYNLWPDPEILWQCPGYFADSEETHICFILPYYYRVPYYSRKYEETHMYGRLIVKSMHSIKERMSVWGIAEKTPEYDETLKECFKAQAVVSLFTTLCAQAHTHGFTQYTDITSPFTSQMVLFDGSKIAFAVGQLNTLAFNIECDGFVNDRTNFVQFEGPYDLFESKKDDDGKTKLRLNELVLKRVVQMLLRD